MEGTNQVFGTSAPALAARQTVLARILGDREQQQANAQIRHPLALQAGLSQPSSRVDVSIRIYVACSSGEHRLVDDRAQLAAELGISPERWELIAAEYSDLTLTSGARPRQGANELEVVPCPSECKGEMLYLLGQNCESRPAVDYVAFIDDDIEVKASDLIRSASDAKQLGLNIFQLALSDDSKAVWPHLKLNEGNQPVEIIPMPLAGPKRNWDQVRFVEIMAPVLAWQEIESGLLNVLSSSKSGFGWDFYLLPCLADLFPGFRSGLFVGTTMRHGRTVNTSNQSRFSNQKTALEEEDRLRAGLAVTLSQGNYTNRAELLNTLRQNLEHPTPFAEGLAHALLSISRRYWLYQELDQQTNELQHEHNVLRQQLSRIEDSKQALEAKCSSIMDRCWELEKSCDELGVRCDQLNLKMSEQQRQALAKLRKAAEQRRAASLKLGAELLRCRENALYYAGVVESMKRSSTWRIGRFLMLPIRATHFMLNLIRAGRELGQAEQRS